MPLRAYVIIAVRIFVLLGLIWGVWLLLRAGLPLSWVAIFFGGAMSFAAIVGLLLDPAFRRAFPTYYASQKAAFGYSLPPRVLFAIRVAYVVLGGAALIWGLMALR